MKEIFQNHWAPELHREMEKPYYQNLRRILIEEYRKGPVYPPPRQIFHALHHTDLPQVKAVILGQDPYHGPGQAHGMSFSVSPGVPIPPSLQNIYKELYTDLHIPPASTGYLMPWAKEGVLLLNTTLTVRHKSPMSHRELDWEIFTNRIIELVDEKPEPVVFLLWGSHARKKKSRLKNPRHLIIEAPHPSPLSAYRGFFGHRPFSRTNEFLEKNGQTPIDWRVEK